MRKAMLMTAAVFVVSTAMVAADVKVPYSDTGAEFIGDVEAVFTEIEAGPDLPAGVERARKSFTANRDKLLADLIAKFTEQVGQAEDVFAALEAKETSEEEKEQLNKKIEEFGSTEGKKFEALIRTLRSSATREIARALGRNGRKFRTALRQRRVTRASIIGRNALSLEAIVGKLGLDAEQAQKAESLIKVLKDSRKTVVDGYAESYTEKVGERDEVRRINREGTAEEKEQLGNKIREWRKEMEEMVKKRSEEAVGRCKNAIVQLLTQKQAAQFEELTAEDK
ncbi:MAG: hypothetical protein HQ592_13715 [Planctomycetes bacterium]|nr:hypothetical protein [Planctomycetota bacterium]